MTGNEAPHARDRWRDLLVGRWPTALGVAVAAMTALDLRAAAGFVPPLPVLIVLMALIYVGAAVLGRRRASWVVLLAALPVAFFLPQTFWVNPLVVLLAAAAAFLFLGAIRVQRLREPGNLALQAAGVLVFGAIALAALYVAPGTGVYLVAFALFGHAAWDAFHYVRDRVVTRSYAEFCGVLDLALGLTILVLA
ncbi:hypothetical protein Rxycam_01411 [Rubrobacter xylanophilus DSM 9941]|uniref:hypothetical protein n=1 Tax=Rubrobacter xylanophilus TaxID=49319 RepID=UPI001C640684|nr:hypothetical protein [Rubrobacter xylanophilus]QYJ15587.1 hypothetical protein Rxycam_01411 [Rubrobacter xylanophilus DSM 9941]